jgi:four helix bundle protein
MDKPHKKLDVWKLSIDLVAETYRLERMLPVEERFNLCSQMRRSASSIPANIAEGAARGTSKEFIHFLHVAQASLSELDTHWEVAKRLGYIDQEGLRDADILMDRIDKMLTRLIQSKRSPRA